MIQSVLSAIKAKAPIVGIHIEGREPVYLDRRRLAAWMRGVTLTSATIEQRTQEWPTTGKIRYDRATDSWVQIPEPVNIFDITSLDVLVLRALDGESKIRAKFAGIHVTVATVKLKDWADKERARQQKKASLGTLTPDQKRAFKRAKFDDDGEGMIAVRVMAESGCTERMGIPVSIPEFPLLNFALVRFGSVEDENVRFSVTELITGKSTGAGASAELAICDARQRAGKLTPERIAQICADIWSAQ